LWSIFGFYYGDPPTLKITAIFSSFSFPANIILLLLDVSMWAMRKVVARWTNGQDEKWSS